MNESRMYHAGNYPPQKAGKALQACNQCRKRRRRCEGGQPCLGCLENFTDCVFDDNDRPPESFRRALRHAQQHANKVEALSQRLDRLTYQVNAIAKRNQKTVPTSNYPDLLSNYPLSEVQSTTNPACPIENWPQVRAMLCRARVTEKATGVAGANFKAIAIADSSVLEATNNPRKRKRERQCTAHLDCARYDQHSISNDADHISRSRADGLSQSYVQDIHKLYPIVDLAQLARVLDRVVGQRHVYSSAMQLPRIRRRLRNLNTSCSADSMPHALLYIILALGEMCEHRRSGRSSADPASLNTQHFEYEPYSPAPTIVDAAVDAAPPRCSSSSRLHKQGLRFYERATRIMGLHLDGNELIHAQVALLAGLYKSLVGHPIESLNWISTASRVMQDLLRRWNIVGHPFMPQVNHQRPNNGHYPHSEHGLNMRRLILLNAWTCVQIEQDMLCHTKLPQNGLLMYEDILPLSCDDLETETGGRSCNEAFPIKGVHQDNIIFMYYTAEVKLRKKIYFIRQHYLNDQCLQLSSEQLCRILRQAREILDDWRFDLPKALQWSDDRLASDDILSIKLRIKFYDWLVNVCRPYLDFVLHIRPYCTTMRDICTLAVDSDGNARSKAETYVFQVLARMPDCEIRDATACCLQAALRSVRTFLSRASGLLLLEINSIASIQYRNVLMLCAAYMALPTRSMLRLDDLVELISSSIAFFKEQALTIEWCSNAAVILQRILAIMPDVE